MKFNKETRLLISDSDKWLTLDNQIFVRFMFLADTLNESDVTELTDEVKQQIEQENESREI